MYFFHLLLFVQIKFAFSEWNNNGNSKKYCGIIEYDPFRTLCCKGLVYIRSGTQPACCGNIGFDARYHYCCGSTIVRKSKYKVPRCCGDKGYDGMFDVCVNGYLDKKTDLGSHCCWTDIGYKCCSKPGTCCSYAGSGQIDIPGFRPACCDITSRTEKAQCCANTKESTGNLPDCCDVEELRPTCCNRADGTTECCSAIDGFCCGGRTGDRSRYQYQPRPTRSYLRQPVNPIVRPQTKPDNGRHNQNGVPLKTARVGSNRQNSHCCSATRQTCCPARTVIQHCCYSRQRPPCCMTSEKYSSSCCNQSNNYALRSKTGSKELNQNQINVINNLKTVKVGKQDANRNNYRYSSQQSAGNRHNQPTDNKFGNIHETTTRRPNRAYQNGIRDNNYDSNPHRNLIYQTTTRSSYHSYQNGRRKNNVDDSNQNRDIIYKTTTTTASGRPYYPHQNRRQDNNFDHANQHRDNSKSGDPNGCCDSHLKNQCCQNGYLSTGYLPKCCSSITAGNIKHSKEKLPIYISPDSNQAFESGRKGDIPSRFPGNQIPSVQTPNIYANQNKYFPDASHKSIKYEDPSLNNQNPIQQTHPPYVTTVKPKNDDVEKSYIIKEIQPPKFISEFDEYDPLIDDVNYQKKEDNLGVQALEKTYTFSKPESSTKPGARIDMHYKDVLMQSNTNYSNMFQESFFHNIISEIEFETMKPMKPHIGDNANNVFDDKGGEIRITIDDPIPTEQTFTHTTTDKSNEFIKTTLNKADSIRNIENNRKQQLPLQTSPEPSEVYPYITRGELLTNEDEDKIYDVENINEENKNIPGENIPLPYSNYNNKMDYYNNYMYNYNYEHMQCNGEPYDLSVHICCDGVLRFRVGVEPKCCSTEAYDAFIYKCCNNVIRRSCDPNYKPKKTPWGAFI